MEGDWVYAVRAVDIAGNVAPWATILLELQPPDNYFLLDFDEDLIPDGTFTNAVEMDGDGLTLTDDWLMPVHARSWVDNIEGEGWNSPQDQVDAGFLLYVQPAKVSEPATFEWEHDYGATIPTVKLSADVFYTVLDGAPTVATLFYVKALAGDAWTLVGPADGSQLVPGGMRYVRIVTTVTPETGRHGLLILTSIQYRLAVQYFTDQGIATTDASGLATVDFNYDFTDVRTVQLSPGDADIKFYSYEVATDQDSMEIFATDETLAPVSGEMSWLVRGF
jgi:hypothetical protein